MNRRLIHSGLALIVLVGLFLPACGTPAAETQVVPTEAKKSIPVPTKKKATQVPDPGVGQGGGGPLAPSEVEITIPNSPQVTPREILDQVVLLGVGGGEHVCRDMNELCVEARSGGLKLVGFRPQQEVIIILHKYIEKDSRFVYYTDWESTIGMDGTLLINIPNLDFFPQAVVLDAQDRAFLMASAPLIPDFEDFYSNRYAPCTDASYQSRLRIGDKVRVAYVNGANLRVRKTTSHKSLENVIGGIPEGTVLYLDSAPQCAEGWVWWQVTYKNKFGWVAEGDGTDWLLEPWK